MQKQKEIPKICLINVYIGKLPNYFQLWLDSCRYNPSIDFLLFTDDKTKYDYPENVKVKYISFQEIKTYIQNKFDFAISLDASYKFCDYKPAYGYIFSDYLKQYDFWGHCDIDLIFGNIRKFLNEIDLNNYDKIFKCGHFTLYKNNEKMINSFKEMIVDGKPMYLNVYSTKDSFFFDEWGKNHDGLLNYWINNDKYRVYTDDSCIADVSTKYNNLVLTKFKKRHIFQWNIDRKNNCHLAGLYLQNGGVHKKEYMYVHFQKRSMSCDYRYANDCSEFIMITNSILFNKKIGKKADFKKYIYPITIYNKKYIKSKIEKIIERKIKRK